MAIIYPRYYSLHSYASYTLQIWVDRHEPVVIQRITNVVRRIKYSANSIGRPLANDCYRTKEFIIDR